MFKNNILLKNYKTYFFNKFKLTEEFTLNVLRKKKKDYIFILFFHKLDVDQIYFKGKNSLLVGFFCSGLSFFFLFVCFLGFFYYCTFSIYIYGSIAIRHINIFP